MTTFKQFITEKPSYSYDIIDLMAASALPLTDKILKSLGFENKKTTAYHATGLEFLKQLKKMERTDKPISTFTKNLWSVVNGISTRPDIIVKLEGTSILDYKGDIFSHPDTTGRRWIKTRGIDKSDFLQHSLNDKIIKEILNHTNSDISIDDMIYDDNEYKKEFSRLNKKEQEKIIKLYISHAEDIMNKKMFSNIVLELLNARSGRYNHNEILMTNFKILGVYSIENGIYAFNKFSAKEDIEEHGFKYLGHIDKSIREIQYI